MGHPKARRSASFAKPLKKFDRARMASETRLMKQYGLKRKHEIWRAESVLRDFRRRARDLLAKPNEIAQKDLFRKINSLGLPASTIEDILSLKIDDILGRRLQTVLVRRGVASTGRQARQLIAHRHVVVGDRIVTRPGYIMRSGEEEKITVSEKVRSKMIKGATP